jgi:creatinine amidohydrolase
MTNHSGPRPFVLSEANYRQLLDDRPRVAILPWGATEAHNYHLPHGSDIIESEAVAIRAAEIAHQRGARPLVLPPIPFGNNAQQQDQVATIHMSTSTAGAVLDDVVASLKRQGIDRLVILNGHGGNEFKPLVRDAQLKHGILIVVLNFWDVCPDEEDEIFDIPGDHAHEMETCLLMHLRPDLVVLDQAGPGTRVPFAIDGFQQTGAWTPRPWSASHPDTGSGDPSQATAEKGKRYFDIITDAIAGFLVNLDRAKKGDSPYL